MAEDDGKDIYREIVTTVQGALRAPLESTLRHTPAAYTRLPDCFTHRMATTVLSISALLTLALEFWLGIAVTFWPVDRPYFERSQAPGPYWAVIVVHTLAVLGLPALKYFSGA